jgi:hypothetical protein
MPRGQLMVMTFLGQQGSKMTRNTTAQICGWGQPLSSSENIICAPPKRGVDRCELAVAVKLMEACRFHGEPRSHWLLPRPPQRNYGDFECVIFAR